MGTAKNNAAYRFAEMPEVDGAMIVESGSNSDGSWTRWADGTQICKIYYEGPTTSNASSSSNQGIIIFKQESPWTYPIAFLEVPTITGTVDQNNHGALTTLRQNIAVGISSVVLESYSLHSWTSFARLELYSIAFGKWK